MELVGTLGTQELSRGGADVHCVQMDALGRLVARELWAGLVVQEAVQSCTGSWATDSSALPCGRTLACTILFGA